MILSLVQNPAKGGTPMMASQPHTKVQNVQGIALRSPPKRRMSVSLPMPCMTEPAPRNMSALKKPWASRWAIAKA